MNTPTCKWCNRPFVPRSTGGKPQRFCCPAHRLQLHARARKWVIAQVESGHLTAETIKNAPEAT